MKLREALHAPAARLPAERVVGCPDNRMPRDDDDDAIAEPKDDSLTYLVRKLRSLLRSEAKDQSLRDLFEKLDKNGDKKVTAVELRKGLKDLGFRLDDDEVRDIIKYCDVDGDGEISYLEFESFVESPECKDADVQDVLDRLREIAEGQGGSIAKRIEEMFEDLDEDLSGDVDADEFHDGLRGLGLTLTVKEAEDITKRFPSTGKNAVGPKGPRIRYRDFVAAVRGKAPASHEAKDSQGDRTATYAVRKLAEEVERCSRTKQGDLDLAGCFRDLDADGSGTLDRTEIRDALDRVGVQLSRKELVEVMEFFGTNANGEVPYEDFVAFALKQDPATARIATKVRNEIERLAERDGRAPDYRGAFRELDDDDSGELDQDEFRSAMRNLGLRLSSAELRQLVNLFDADGDGVVSYREFIDFVEKIPVDESSESKDDGEAKAEAKW